MYIKRFDKYGRQKDKEGLAIDSLTADVEQFTRIRDQLPSVIARAAGTGENLYTQFQIPIPACDLLSIRSAREFLPEKSFYWHVPAEDFEFLAGGTLAESRSAGPGRFRAADRQYQRWMRRRVILPSGQDEQTVPFSLVSGAFFDSMTDEAWGQFAPMLLYLPEWVMVRTGGRYLAGINLEISKSSSPDDILDSLTRRLRNLESDPDGPREEDFGGYSLSVNGQKQTWMNMVSSGVRAIREHALDKVVVGAATQVDLAGDLHVSRLLSDLAENYPSCVTFALREAAGDTFFGSTPEWLLRISAGKVRCGALAGSTLRSEDPAQDAQLGEALLQNRKNLDEHAYVVQYITEKINHIASDVSVAARPQLQKLKNVQHLYTPIEGRLNTTLSPLQILEHFHPTPAVGGIPTDKALQFIRELEQYDRGYFTGPTGWLSQDGDLDIAVGLRSALLHDRQVYVYAGAGIVKDSDPGDEYEERRLKLQPILSALQHAANHG